MATWIELLMFVPVALVFFGMKPKGPKPKNLDLAQWHINAAENEFKVCRRKMTYYSDYEEFRRYEWTVAKGFRFSDSDEESRAKALTDAEEYLFTLRDSERRALEAS